MSRIKGYTITEQITAAYAAQISVLWDFEAETSVYQARIRKYCPSCKKFDTLIPAKPTDAKDFLKLICGICGHRCNNPASLKPRGGSFGESIRSTRVGRGANSNRLINAMSNSLVMSAVEAQPADIRDLLLWLYTDPDERALFKLEGSVMSNLAGRLDNIESDYIKGLRAYGSVVHLLQLQVRDFKLDRQQGKRPKMRAASYAEAIGRDRSQFSGDRLWGRVMRAIHAEMVDMDNCGLTSVEEALYLEEA